MHTFNEMKSGRAAEAAPDDAQPQDGQDEPAMKPTKVIAASLFDVYRSYKFLMMTAYFRDVAGCLAALCGLFQKELVQLDQIKPALASTMDTISTWYPDTAAPGSERVKEMEAKLMAGEYAGFSVPRPTDQEKAAVRELMFTHACFVVSALDERFPQADLVH
eukprot:7774315-Pyramimonas_sp.AAC.1